LLGLRHADQRASGVVAPRMKRTGEATLRSTFIGLDDNTAVAAGVDEGPEGSMIVACGEDGHTKVIVREERSGSREIARHSDALGCRKKELRALTLGLLTVGECRGWLGAKPTRINVRAGIEMGTKLFHETDLLVVAHIRQFDGNF
jgi:hypothetical protein